MPTKSLACGRLSVKCFLGGEALLRNERRFGREMGGRIGRLDSRARSGHNAGRCTAFLHACSMRFMGGSAVERRFPFRVVSLATFLCLGMGSASAQRGIGGLVRAPDGHPLEATAGLCSSASTDTGNGDASGTRSRT